MGLVKTVAGWPAIRRAALDRDGWRCLDCGRRARLEVHHVRSLKHGGSNDLDNLRTLCYPCHKAAHGQPVAPQRRDWQRMVAELL